jgi:superfamily II DNA or RNA helicase
MPMKNDQKRNASFDVLKNFFKSKPDYSELLERYSALQSEHEKLLAEHSALRRRLEEYERGHETVSSTEHKPVPITEHDVAPITEQEIVPSTKHAPALITEHETVSITEQEAIPSIGREVAMSAEARHINDSAQTDQATSDIRAEARFGEQLSLDTSKMTESNTAEESRGDNSLSLETASLIRVDRDSSNDEKVALFLSLFIGRGDCFAKHYYNKKTNSSAYSPVCDNEWDNLLCFKRTKEFSGEGKSLCSQCRHPAYTKFDANAVNDHLRGFYKDRNGRRQDFIAGIYPLLDGNTCRFLAVDFDAHNPDSGDCLTSLAEEVKTFGRACTANAVPVYFERSRSGNGYHAWIFFCETVSAASARQMGAGLITYAMEHFGRVSFRSYDRFFPNQDVLPKGGFGNLIALPLQRKARESGNTVFLDENLEPFNDQWAFLSSVKRMTRADVDEVVSRICNSPDGLGEFSLPINDDEEQKPWEKRKAPKPLTAHEFGGEVEMISANMIFVPKAALSTKAANRIRRLAVIKNPEFAKKQRMLVPTGRTPRLIFAAREYDSYLGLPRGLLPELEKLLEESGADYRITDKRSDGDPIKVTFLGELKDEQQSAASALLEHDNGVLHAATAFGKTVVGDFLIAERAVNTLIIVPTNELLSMWKGSIDKFLKFDYELPAPEKKRGRPKKRSLVGQLGGGKNTLNGIVDIAIYKSLLKDDGAKDFVKDYGMVIVDECHHVGASSYAQVLDHVNAKYVYGVTATPIRSDGLDALIFFHCGQVRYRTDMKQQMKRHGFDHVMVPRFTSLKPIALSSLNNMPSIYGDLVNMEGRNRKILDDIAAELREGRTPLVLTERVEHIETLAKSLDAEAGGVETIRLFGGLSAKEKRLAKERLAALSPGKQFVIVATSKYIGEGFDLPALDTLFLTMPIKWKGRLEQYVGRLHRGFEGKEEVRVYDYIDIRVPALERMYRARLKGYASFGYTVKTEMGVPDNVSMIYSADDYRSALEKDLTETNKCVAVSGPKVPKARISAIQQHFPLNIETEIFLSDLLFIIIDRRIVWYGEINYFGRNGGSETCLRIDSRELAEELLEFARDVRADERD